jgi:hypothetical protein
MKPWIAIASLLWASSAWAVTEIEAVSGSGGVTVTRAGKSEAADEGDTLQTGDQLAVGPKTAVRVLFGDGSHLTLSEGCAVEFAKPVQGAAGVVLLRGHLQANVAKVAPTAVPNAVPQLKFFVKTNAAVMGVRGTEFTVDHDDKGGASDLHTLDGTVEVAGNDDELAQGKGRRVEALQQLRADRKGLGPIQKFERGGFLKHLAQRHERAQELGKRALRNEEERRTRREARHEMRQRLREGRREARPGAREERKDERKERIEDRKDKLDERKEKLEERKEKLDERKQGLLEKRDERREGLQEKKEALQEKKEALRERRAKD